MQKIAILGGGNLGQAIAWGLLESKSCTAEQLYVTRNRVERLNALKEEGVKVSNNNLEAVQCSQIIILAVKPYKILDVLDGIRLALTPEHIIVSVATGITTEQILSAAQKELSVFRAMPNTAIAIRESITCICAKNANETERQKIVDLFNNLGQAVEIQEELMEAATVLGACGIAYVLRFIRAMMQGGIEIGFGAEIASTIATQTVKGAAELLIKGGKHPEEEIDKVTTPKGCTISGLNEMEHRGFSSSLIKGILNSYQKIEK
ncbi:MAG: pyrroline-5-carboxylate reductase [Saprospiraceae bacterium]|nr:pyrroline-5-carboxylate reductase [Saprospiraceae bacterium]